MTADEKCLYIAAFGAAFAKALREPCNANERDLKAARAEAGVVAKLALDAFREHIRSIVPFE